MEELKQMIGAEKNKLFPTDVGMIVTDFLIENFPNIMDYGFTANVEEEFDHVATGALKWNDMIQHFYTPFHETITDAGGLERVSAERALGTDPKSGKPVIARMGRYGPMLQIGVQEDEGKRFASIPA
jgi:DNA topoisomerase-1